MGAACGPPADAGSCRLCDRRLQDKRELLHDAFLCFAVVQMCNGAVAALVSCVGTAMDYYATPGGVPLMPWSLLRFLALFGVGHASLVAFRDTSSERTCGLPARVAQAVALVAQLAWFVSELVLGSAALALAPLLAGKDGRQGAPQGLALRVYGCAALIALGACLCFHARRRRRVSTAACCACAYHAAAAACSAAELGALGVPSCAQHKKGGQSVAHTPDVVEAAAFAADGANLPLLIPSA